MLLFTRGKGSASTVLDVVCSTWTCCCCGCFLFSGFSRHASLIRLYPASTGTWRTSEWTEGAHHVFININSRDGLLLLLRLIDSCCRVSFSSVFVLPLPVSKIESFNLACSVCVCSILAFLSAVLCDFSTTVSLNH